MTTNANPNTDTNRDEELKKVIAALYHRTTQLIKEEFPEYNVSGHVRYHNYLGPFLVFELKNEAEQSHYSCGFLFNELAEKLKDPNHAKQWIASFYVDMMDENVNKPLPTEPKDAEEANAIIRDVVLPYCLKSLREEFGDNVAHVKFTNHPKAGAILEAGIPSIKDGHNVCAIPINLLLALYLLNRDCAELIINGLYKLRKDAGLE